jgi:hypothetical protein
MAPDDEILFGHAVDESRYSYEHVEALSRQAYESPLPPDVALAMAEFELHGATLRSLMRWYPDEVRVRKALVDWELFSSRLTSSGLPVTHLS